MALRKCLWVGVVCFVGLAACNGEDKAEKGPAVDTEQLAASEDALLGKRDALFNMRQTLSEKRAALETERAQVREAGGDTSEIDKKAVALAEEERVVAGKQSDLIKELISEQSELRAAVVTGGGGGDKASQMASRETGMAGRERQIARRENEVATREAALAKREEGLASKWKDGCAVAAPTTIIRTVDTKGSSYTKKDVEPLLKRARLEMGKKGLLKSDLPDQAKGLEKEANDGMRDGDYGRARLAASQLLGTVKAIRINKAFIAAKIARLNQRIGGKSLSSKSEKLFREATSSYGDAKFSSANGKLNKIYSSL